MKSIFCNKPKPLSDFDEAVLVNIEDNYLGLLLNEVIDKETIPSGWFAYYIQASTANTINFTIFENCPSKNVRGTLLLEHPYKLKGFFKKKILPVADFSPIERVDIDKYLTMESPADFSYEEMCELGYQWDGMYPIKFETLKEILNNSLIADVPFYFLGNDNTEIVIESSSDIPENPEDYLYGIQKPDWYHHLYRSDDEEIEEEK